MDACAWAWPRRAPPSHLAAFLNSESSAHQKNLRSNPNVAQSGCVPRDGGRVVCLTSGGVDSAVTIGVLAQRSFEVLPLFVDYGQAARVAERAAFAVICSHFSLRGFEVSLTMPSDAANSALLGGDGASYFLLHRNLTLLIAGDVLAASTQASYVAAGFCRSSAAYPDCSRSFCALAQQMIQMSGNSSRILLAPLVDLPKRSVIELAHGLAIPIGLTVSCYRTHGPCGHCDGCVDLDQALNTGGTRAASPEISVSPGGGRRKRRRWSRATVIVRLGARSPVCWRRSTAEL
jgi:7-cyano-7-deazaguanine synthase